MKKIKLETYELSLGKEEKVSTISLIEYCMDIQPQGGYTPAILRKYSRIQKVLDSLKEKLPSEKVLFLHFEDEDVKTLKEAVNNSRWGTRNKEIERFLDNVEKM